MRLRAPLALWASALSALALAAPPPSAHLRGLAAPAAAGLAPSAGREARLEAPAALAQAEPLAAQLAAAEAASAALQAKLNRTSAASAEAEARLRAALDATARRLHGVEARLQAAEQNRSALLGNVSSLQQRVAQLSKMARRERLMLLNQVSELQEDAQASQSRRSDAVQQLEQQLSAQVRRSGELASELAARDRESQRLLGEARRAAAAAGANASALGSQLAAARQQGGELARALAGRQLELREAVQEGADLRAAKEQADRDLAKLQQQGDEEKAALQREDAQLQASQQELAAARAAKEALASQAEALRREAAELRAAQAQLQNRSAAQRAGAEAQLHSVMLSAASKVHDMEEHVDTLQDQLAQAQRALAAETADDSRTKDLLLQQSQAAAEASREAEALNSSLAEARSSLRLREAKVAALASRVAGLEADGRRASASLLDVSRASRRWQEKIESLEQASQQATSQARAYKSENTALRTKLADLSREGQQADALASELAELRATVAANRSRELRMAEQMQRLRELKDHYSSELEGEEQEVSTWRAKAQDEAAKLQAQERAAAVVARQRDAAQERIRAARSEVDEYFEENTRLQQQGDALQGKLDDAGRAAARAAAERAELKHEIAELHGDVAREQQAEHAAWLSSSRALTQEQQQVKAEKQHAAALQAELTHTEAVLLDWQRKALGLPPLPKAPAKPRPAAASPTVTAKHTAPAAKRAKHMAARRGAAAPPAASTLQRLAEYFSSSPLRS